MKERSKNKSEAQKVLAEAIKNCKVKSLHQKSLIVPCDICGKPSDMKADEKIHIDEFKLSLGINSCENCYDNLRMEIEEIDPALI